MTVSWETLSLRLDGDVVHHAGHGGMDRVFHLHRLDHGDQVSGRDLLALLHGDRHDRSLHRREDEIVASVRRAIVLWPAVDSPPDGFRRRTLQQCKTREPDGQGSAAETDRCDVGHAAIVGRGSQRGCGREKLLVDPPGVDREGGAVPYEVGVFHHLAVERHHGRQSFDPELGQGPAGPRQRVVTVAADDDQLGQQGVELATHDRARLHARVDPHAGSPGQLEAGHGARGGEKLARRILGIQAELEGVTKWRRLRREVERRPLGDSELGGDDVDAGRLFGNGVLDLEAGVHLQERDRPVLADQIFHRPRTLVAGGPTDGRGGVVDLTALAVGEERRRCLLHQLLVAALERTVPGADHDDVAVGVGQDLRLDVAGPSQVPLDEAFAAAEGQLRLPGGRGELLRNFLQRVRHLDASAPTAECGLDRHRQPVVPGEVDDLVGAAHRLVCAGCHGGADSAGQPTGGDLVAHRPHRRRGRADPQQPRSDDRLGEGGVFGEEPVSRMEGVGAGSVGHRQQGGPVQVRVGRRGPR